MVTDRRRPGPSRPKAPVAAMVLVLAIALVSTVVWISHAAPPMPADEAEATWWPGMGAVPTR